MLIAETALALSIVCTVPKRAHGGKNFDSTPCVIATSTPHQSFQVADGISLEGRLREDLARIQGVTGVQVKTSGDGLEVNVILDTLEYSVFEQVVQKELDLFDQFPNLPVKFNVAQRGEENTLPNAA